MDLELTEREFMYPGHVGCPGCGADAIDRKGVGTEQVAAAIAARFPEARVARLADLS